MDFLPDSGEDVRGSGERNDETDSPEPHSGFQGEGGDGGAERRENPDELSQQFEVHATQITKWKAQLVDGAAGIFGGTPAGLPPLVDIKILHAKIGELALENDFLSGALSKAGLLSAKR